MFDQEVAMSKFPAVAAAVFVLMGDSGFAREVRPPTAEILLVQGTRAQAPICRRMCLEDRNPCDPIAFKIADRRCSRRIQD